MSPSGTLYVVATPIGHLEDITLRALRILRTVSWIAAEDTRHTRKLLAAYDIHTPLTSYHDHNKEEKAPVLIARLQGGEDIALVVDAGTPGISDPGFYLVQKALEATIPVSPIPGPSALVAALSVAGLPPEPFVFEGFLPSRREARRRRLQALREDPRTLVFFEAPHRIRTTLEDLQEILGDRKMALCRELTKIHETILRGPVSQIRQQLGDAPVRGEMTLIMEGNPCPTIPRVPEEAVLEGVLMAFLQAGFSVNEASRQAARALGISRHRAYQRALALKSR